MPRPGPRSAARDRLVVLAVVVAALVVTLPGYHLLATRLDDLPAKLVSHAAGLALLGVAVRRWRLRRG